MGHISIRAYTLHQAEERIGSSRAYLHKASYQSQLQRQKNPLQSVKMLKKVCISVTCWSISVGKSGVRLIHPDSMAVRGACSSSELADTVVLQINIIHSFKLLWSSLQPTAGHNPTAFVYSPCHS